MRAFSIIATSAISALITSSCQGAESEVSAPQINQSVVDVIADLPRNEVSECLAAAEWIHFHTKSLGQEIEHTSAIKDHWLAAYKQSFSIGYVSPKKVLKESDFRQDQNGLDKASQMAVRDKRIDTCMAYSTDALQQNGFEVNMADKS